jgi:hypothetical protein
MSGRGLLQRVVRNFDREPLAAQLDARAMGDAGRTSNQNQHKNKQPRLPDPLVTADE